MAEYIERENLLKQLEKIPAYFDSGDTRYGIEIAIDQTKKQSAADVVKVVRCWECRHFTPKEKLNPIKYINPLEADGLCENCDKYIDADDFCSYGELKEREG